MIEILETKNQAFRASDSCPKCGEKLCPEGAYIKSPLIKIQQRVKLFFFWLPIKISFELQYCPKCGYLAIREVSF